MPSAVGTTLLLRDLATLRFPRTVAERASEREPEAISQRLTSAAQGGKLLRRRLITAPQASDLPMPSPCPHALIPVRGEMPSGRMNCTNRQGGIKCPSVRENL